MSHGTGSLHHLLFGIRERKGFIQLTAIGRQGQDHPVPGGARGAGPSFRTALILNPALTAHPMLRTSGPRLGLTPGRDRPPTSACLIASCSKVGGRPRRGPADRRGAGSFDGVARARAPAFQSGNRPAQAPCRSRWSAKPSCATMLDTTSCGSCGSASRFAITCRALTRRNRCLHPVPLPGGRGRCPPELRTVGIAADLSLFPRHPGW